MGILTAAPPRRIARERLDQPHLDDAELRANLKDLERLNRLFGGTAAVLAKFRRMAGALGSRGRITVLDAGTGGADIPRALVRWGRRTGLRVEVLACDRHERILKAAAESSAAYPEISFRCGDVLELPLERESVDVALCTLAAHHLTEDEVVALFRKLKDAARVGFIFTDLRRGRVARAGVWLATRVLSRNGLTRHDGPLSVERAYTLEELRRLADAAGCEEMRLRPAPLFRVTGALTKRSLHAEA